MISYYHKTSLLPPLCVRKKIELYDIIDYKKVNDIKLFYQSVQAWL